MLLSVSGSDSEAPWTPERLPGLSLWLKAETTEGGELNGHPLIRFERDSLSLAFPTPSPLRGLFVVYKGLGPVLSVPGVGLSLPAVLFGSWGFSHSTTADTVNHDRLNCLPESVPPPPDTPWLVQVGVIDANPSRLELYYGHRLRHQAESPHPLRGLGRETLIGDRFVGTVAELITTSVTPSQSDRIWATNYLLRKYQLN